MAYANSFRKWLTQMAYANGLRKWLTQSGRPQGYAPTTYTTQMALSSEDKDYKKRLAKDYWLYSPYNQQEIADKVGVTTQTMGKWKEEDKWEELKSNLLKIADKRIANYCKMLDLFSQKLEEATVDIDGLTKLQSLLDKNAIKGTEASEIEKVGLAMVKFIEERMPEKRDFYIDFYRSFAEWYNTIK